MAASSRRRRQLYTYFGFLLLAGAVLLAGRHVKQTGVSGYEAVDALAPVYSTFRRPVSWGHTAYDMLTSHIATAAENRYLRRENLELRAWRNEALYLRAENRELSQLLALTKAYPIKPVAARVLADTRSPYARTVLIDAGTAKDLAVGQAVLGPDGLVGRILEVRANSARVLLLTDHNTRVPVKLIHSGGLAILRGGNARRMQLILSDGPLRPMLGEQVVTSGVGGVFTPGLPVGRVVAANADGTNVEVAPFANFATLDRVVVQVRPVSGILKDYDQADTAQ